MDNVSHLGIKREYLPVGDTAVQGDYVVVGGWSSGHSTRLEVHR